MSELLEFPELAVRAVINASGRSGARPGFDASRVRAAHARLPGYAPTPLHEAPLVASELGVGHVYVKDESSRLGLPAFKILGAFWGAYRALCTKLRAEPQWANVSQLAEAFAALGPLELVAATDGNHGRAVARVARWFGLTAHILVPVGTARARVDAIAAEGARVDVVDGSYDDAVRTAAGMDGAGRLVVADTAYAGYTAIPRWVVEGYSTILYEMDEQLAAAHAPPPDIMVSQVGVGSLASAAIGHLARRELSDRPVLVTVEPLDADCALQALNAGVAVEVPGPHRSIMAGLNAGVVSDLALPVLLGGVQVALAVGDRYARQAMNILAADGISAGETGSSGLAALLAVRQVGAALAEPCALHAEATVVLICTEGPTDPRAYEAITGKRPVT